MNLPIFLPRNAGGSADNKPVVVLITFPLLLIIKKNINDCAPEDLLHLREEPYDPADLQNSSLSKSNYLSRTGDSSVGPVISPSVIPRWIFTWKWMDCPDDER